MADKKVTTYYEIDGVDKAIKDQKDLAAAVADTNDELKQTGGGNKLTKGLKSIGKVGKTAFKGIGTAIKASGIGLLVAVVAKLVEQFTKTDAGAKILQGSMAVLGVVFEQIEKAVTFLVDNLVKVFTDPKSALDSLNDGVDALFGWFSSLGDYIKNNFLLLIQNLQKELLEVRIAWNDWTGDTEEAAVLRQELADLEQQMMGTKEAIVTAGEEVAAPFVAAAEFIGEVATEIATQVTTAIKTSNAAIDAANKFADLTNRLAVENAQLNKELEDQKKISEDTTRAYEERSAALEEVIKRNEQIVANAVLEAQANENLIKQQLAIASNDEDRRDLEQQLAEAKVARIEAESAASIVELESAQLRRELDQEELDRKTAIAQQLEDLAVENITNEQERELAALDLAKERALAELDLLRATDEEKERLANEFEKKREAIIKKGNKTEEQLAQESAEKRRQIATSALSILSDLATVFSKDNEKNAERNFKINKALGIASATVNTALAISDALAKDATFPGSRFIAAAAAGAAGLAQIVTIKRQQFQSPTLPETPTETTFAAGAAAASNFLSVSDQLGQQEADITAIGQGGPPPIRTYVVAGDVTTAQEADKAIEDLATL